MLDPKASDGHIVVLRHGSTRQDLAGHVERVQEFALARSYKLNVTHRYHIGRNFTGYAAHMDAELVAIVGELSDVRYVERNSMVYASGLAKPNVECVTQEKAEWGLVRTSERERQLDGRYIHEPESGENVFVYVVDTGIYLEHIEFIDGRAVWGTDVVVQPSPRTDPNGHGTHVAALAVGRVFGVSKFATAVAVRVLSESGSGSTEDVLAGIDWAVYNHTIRKGPGVMSLALGGGLNTAFNDAVAAAVLAGLQVVTGSGGSNQDACQLSPSSEVLAFTTSATNDLDEKASWSSWGHCVDIFAPGVGITSASIDGPTANRTLSGSSMAVGLTSGVSAKYLGANPNASPTELRVYLVEASTKDVVTGIEPEHETPNRLLYRGCPP